MMSWAICDNGVLQRTILFGNGRDRNRGKKGGPENGRNVYGA